jgi:hypothetical protein
MKKFLMSAIVLMVLASCEEPNVKEVINIEGCEYFLIQYDRSKSMCHKGNCTNPIHKQQEQ